MVPEFVQPPLPQTITGNFTLATEVFGAYTVCPGIVESAKCLALYGPLPKSRMRFFDKENSEPLAVIPGLIAGPFGGTGNPFPGPSSNPKIPPSLPLSPFAGNGSFCPAAKGKKSNAKLPIIAKNLTSIVNSWVEKSPTDSYIYPRF